MNQRSDFKWGDVVQLVSGGPAMAVESMTRTDGLVGVCWFDRHGCLHTGAGFPPGLLVKYEATGGAVVPLPERTP